jgi:aldose 1-epimerase
MRQTQKISKINSLCLREDGQIALPVLWEAAVIAPSGEQITITAGDQQAVIVEVGGGLRSYSTGGRELVDGYRADEMSSSGRGQVLIPWPNRLRDGSYEFDGRRHQLPLNEPERRNVAVLPSNL